MTRAASIPCNVSLGRAYLLLADMTHVEQVMIEALTSKTAIAEGHKVLEALQDMEDYFGVKGLLTNAATVAYKRHNARIHKAIQAAAAAAAVQTCRWACMSQHLHASAPVTENK